jgi:hypothetical protein
MWQAGSTAKVGIEVDMLHVLQASQSKLFVLMTPAGVGQLEAPEPINLFEAIANDDLDLLQVWFSLAEAADTLPGGLHAITYSHELNAGNATATAM